MDRLFTWSFWKAALIRAIHTMAQTALGVITIGLAISDIDWIHTASIAAVAGIYSLLKSIVVSVPEIKQPDIELIDLEGEKLYYSDTASPETQEDDVSK